MGIALLLALLAVAAASGGKKVPEPAPKPSDDEIDGDKGGPYTATGPKDSSASLNQETTMTGPKDLSAPLNKDATGTSATKRFVDLGGDLFAPKPTSWIGVHTLPQPLRNLALNVLKNVIYSSVMSAAPAPLCMKSGGCSSEAIFAVIKEVLKAGLKDSHKDALRELYAAYDKVREAGQ